MDEENIEETQNEDEPSEKTQEEEQTSEKTDKSTEEPTNEELKAKADGILQRYQSEKKKRQELEAKLAKNEKPASDVDAIVEVQQATKELDSTEIAELKIRADANGVSLTEARKDENFVLWQKAYKEKVEKENAPEPSTKQGDSKQTKSLSEMGLEEKGEYFAKQGFVKPFPKARPL